MSEQENKGGRPRHYETPEEMESVINAYFEERIKTDTHPTLTGLMLYMGFCHREALADYEKRDGFSDICKKARLMVENGYETALMRQSPTGAIFALKNMGWKDKSEVEQSGSLTINWNEELTNET